MKRRERENSSRECSLRSPAFVIFFSTSTFSRPPPSLSRKREGKQKRLRQQTTAQLARLCHPGRPGHGKPPCSSSNTRDRPHGLEARPLARRGRAVAATGLCEEGPREQAGCGGSWRGDAGGSWWGGIAAAAPGSGTAEGGELAAALLVAAAGRRPPAGAAPRQPPKGEVAARRHQRLHARPCSSPGLPDVQRRERRSGRRGAPASPPFSAVAARRLTLRGRVPRAGAAGRRRLLARRQGRAQARREGVRGQEVDAGAFLAGGRGEVEAGGAGAGGRGHAPRLVFFTLREGGVFQRSFPCFSLPSRESFRDSAILEETRIGLADDHEQQQKKKKNHFAAPILLWRREPRFFNGKKERGGELTLFNEFSLPLVSSEKTIYRDREVLRRMGGERATRCVFFLLGGSGGEMKRKRFCFFELGQSFSPQNSTLLLSQHH